MAGNREYKSDVFSMLMEDKAKALQVYNAVNGSDYDDPELVQICRLDRGVSLSVRNDAAFVLDASLSIYEHQSTVCPNMPVRSLVYFSGILEKMIKDSNIYGQKLVRLPVPKFAVFYNGVEEQPEQQEMKLSDAFEYPVERPELELICKVYNINKGRNKELLENCPVLTEYMTFVDYVRDFHRENGREQLELSIEQAIDRCISEGVLKEFLMERRSEVLKTMQLDYTFERQIMLERKDSWKEGHSQGLSQGLSQGKYETLILQISKKKAKNYTVSETAEMLETNENLVQKVYDALETYDAATQWEEIMKLLNQT